jgi:hypothetical protein
MSWPAASVGDDEFVGSPPSYRREERRPLPESGVIDVTRTRADALARLDVFIGEWVVEARFPEAPDSLSIVSADLETGAYVQHYYDSRGVVRLYAMTLADGVWTLTRESPDFTPLEFRQRFTGRFSQDGNTITGAWEKRFDGGEWEHDFALTYRRAG